MLTAAALGYGWPGGAGLVLVLLTLLLLVFAVTALSLGLAFALPGRIELIAVIFRGQPAAVVRQRHSPGPAVVHAVLAGLACGFESLPSRLNPYVLPIAVHWIFPTVLVEAPYGDVTGFGCLSILVALTVGLFLLIRPLLNASCPDPCSPPRSSLSQRQTLLANQMKAAHAADDPVDCCFYAASGFIGSVWTLCLSSRLSIRLRRLSLDSISLVDSSG